MKVKMLKNVKWSIDNKAIPFTEGEERQVPNEIGKRMIETKYASEIKAGRPKKETLVEETKVIKPEENKSEDPKKPKKSRKKNK